MKKLTSIILLFCIAILSGCSSEQLDHQDNRKRKIKNPQLNLPVETSDTDNGEHCVYTELIAGQHHSAGSVTIDVDGDNLIVTYTMNDDWTIGTTHLSIGICDEDWVPTTGSGNPQIGQFEFTDPYLEGSNEVVYIIPITDIGDNYCFAAHAEVVGPDGEETAWSNGYDFSGNSWAMFNEFNLSDCNSDDDDDDDNVPT